jgi:hypothetical protein
MITTMTRRLLPLALLFAFVFVGCDTAEEDGEEFPLVGEDNASFTFNFDDLAAGETATSEPQTQLSQDIIDDGRFSPSDVVSARIEEGSVEIEINFPPTGEQIAVSTATLTLDADGLDPQVVARGEDFTLVISTTTAPQRATLDTVDGDITEFLQQESFTGTLMLDVEEVGDADYQFTVTFDVEATVNRVAPPAPSF